MIDQSTAEVAFLDRLLRELAIDDNQVETEQLKPKELESTKSKKTLKVVFDHDDDRRKDSKRAAKAKRTFQNKLKKAEQEPKNSR